MSKKLKKRREFHFNLSVLFRWLIFALIFYFSISFLSGNKSSINTNLNTSNLNILGINSEPVIIKATETYQNYQKQFIDYLNNQVNDIKKQLVTKLYEGIINNIENTNK